MTRNVIGRSATPGRQIPSSAAAKPSWGCRTAGITPASPTSRRPTVAGNGAQPEPDGNAARQPRGKLPKLEAKFSVGAKPTERRDLLSFSRTPPQIWTRGTCSHGGCRTQRTGAILPDRQIDYTPLPSWRGDAW